MINFIKSLFSKRCPKCNEKMVEKDNTYMCNACCFIIDKEEG